MNKIVLCLALFIGMQAHADAQFWKKVQKRVENRAENRALNEVDKATDKAIDSALEGDQDSSERTDSEETSSTDATTQSEKEQQQASDFMSKMLGGNNVELPAEYAIDIRINYNVTDDKGKESKLSYLLGGEDHWGFISSDKKNETMMIVDKKRDVMVLYSEDKGKKTAQKLPSMMNSQFMADAVDNSDEVTSDFSITETGKTKVIAGYSCTEYFIQSDEGSGNIWTTAEIDADFMSMFAQSMSKSKKLKKMSEAMKRLNGTTLESHYTDKKGKESHMVATSVDTSPPAIQNSDYEITGLGQ